MGIIEKQSVQDIANAIRNRNGLTTLYKPREMDEAIRNLYSTTKVNSMLDYILPCYEKEATDYTIQYADADRPGSISKLEGNTTQNGTPTPTNPIPISTVSGDNEVLVRGKNLFNYNGEILENYINGSGMTYSVSNGEYTLNGSNTRTYIYIRYDTVLPAGTYFFSGCPSGGSTNGYSGLLQANGTNYFDFGSGVSFTLNAETTVKVYPIRVGGSRITVDNLKFKTQIEKGNTKTSFEPYIGNSYRVDFGGKNKLQPISESQTVNGITFTLNEDKSITLNGTATANALVTVYGSWSGTTIYQTLDKNSYYTISGSPSNDIQVFIRTTNGSTITSHNPYSSPTFTGQIGIVNYFIQVISGLVCDNITIYPQLEKGTVATEYSPYVSNPIWGGKIGNYEDSIFEAITGNPKYDSLDSTTKASLTYGNWYIEKNIGKKVFVGDDSENWYYNAESKGFSIATSFFADRKRTAYMGYCNYFSVNTNSTTWTALNYCGWNTGGTFWFKDNGYMATSKADLLTYLSTHNLIVYYVLSTPTYEIITNENLIQQLNNLQDIGLIENLCYVDWVGEEKPKMKLFCYLDKDKIIEEITG